MSGPSFLMGGNDMNSETSPPGKELPDDEKCFSGLLEDE